LCVSVCTERIVLFYCVLYSILLISPASIPTPQSAPPSQPNSLPAISTWPLSRRRCFNYNNNYKIQIDRPLSLALPLSLSLDLSLTHTHTHMHIQNKSAIMNTAHSNLKSQWEILTHTNKRTHTQQQCWQLSYFPARSVVCRWSIAVKSPAI